MAPLLWFLIGLPLLIGPILTISPANGGHWWPRSSMGEPVLLVCAPTLGFAGIAIAVSEWTGPTSPLSLILTFGFIYRVLISPFAIVAQRLPYWMRPSWAPPKGRRKGRQ